MKDKNKQNIPRKGISNKNKPEKMTFKSLLMPRKGREINDGELIYKGLDEDTVNAIKKDREGRIRLVKEDEEENYKDKKIIGSMLGSKKKKEQALKKSMTSDKQRQLLERSKSQRYVWVRREVEGFPPLYELGIWDKIFTAKKYLDMKSGKTAKKLEAQRMQEEEKKIKIESKIKRDLTEQADKILENEIKDFTMLINIEPKYIECVEKVLMSDYFSLFEVKQEIPNPNLKIYKIFAPIKITMKRKQKGVQMI